MMTKEQVQEAFPWLEYVEEDEVTGMRKLSEFTPQHYVDLYTRYKEKIEKETANGVMLSKDELLGYF